jgi:hypothetical protein
MVGGAAMSAFVPIHQTSVERSPVELVPWIRKWPGKEAILLSEMGWLRGTMWRVGK